MIMSNIYDKTAKIASTIYPLIVFAKSSIIDVR